MDANTGDYPSCSEAVSPTLSIKQFYVCFDDQEANPLPNITVILGVSKADE
jgi:hypothetical protein